MALQFGSTWWGGKWVNSIEDATYSNRLPRVKSYARNGSVSKIEIENSRILAKVQGSRRKPYDVTVELRPFTKQENKKILRIINKNSAYLSALLVRKLPEKLFYDCGKEDINIFPKKWSDFEADCSCPDWADCCKHIAAVIYIIGNEIDRNPFLSFQLHGLDILQKIQAKKTIEGADSSQTTILNIDELTFDKKRNNSSNWKFNHEIFEKIDFSIIPDSRGKLLSLLSDNPLFGTGKNFKIPLDKFYKDISRVSQYLKLKFEVIREGEQFQTGKFTQNSIILKDELSIKKITFAYEERRLTSENTSSLLKIVDLAMQIPLKTFAIHEKTLLSFSLIARFALKIIEKGAFIPEILSKRNAYFIRYIPATMIKEVKDLNDMIMKLIPEDLISIEDNRAKPLFLTKDETVKVLFSLIFDAVNLENNKFFHRLNKVEAMFFNGDVMAAKSFHEREIPNTISLWLSRLHLEKMDYTPLLIIEENSGKFIMDLAAENRKKQLNKPIPLEAILNEKEFSDLRFDILKTVELLKDFLPELDILLKSNGRTMPVLSSENFEKIFFEILPIFKLLGINVLLPKILRELIIPRPTLEAIKKSPKTESRSYISLDSMMDFKWKIALGEKYLSLEEFKNLVREKRGLIKFKEQFIYLDEKEMRKIIGQMEKSSTLSPAARFEAIFTGKYQGTNVVFDQNLSEQINKFLKIKSLNVPKALKANLRPYQNRTSR